MHWTTQEAWQFLSNLIQLALIVACVVSALVYGATHSKHGRLYQDAHETRKHVAMTMQDMVIYRHAHGVWPGGIAPVMQELYEFHYFSVPEPSEISDPRKYAIHVSEYKRGQKWIAAGM